MLFSRDTCPPNLFLYLFLTAELAVINTSAIYWWHGSCRSKGFLLRRSSTADRMRTIHVMRMWMMVWMMATMMGMMMMMMGNKVKVGDLLQLTTWSSRATTAITASTAKPTPTKTARLLLPQLPLSCYHCCYYFCCPPVFATFTFLQQPDIGLWLYLQDHGGSHDSHLLVVASHVDVKLKWDLSELERQVCAKMHYNSW